MSRDRAQAVKLPGKGWFNYFSICGPHAPAFDGTWKLTDIEAV